jgi:adenosine/AMP kinase
MMLSGRFDSNVSPQVGLVYTALTASLQLKPTTIDQSRVLSIGIFSGTCKGVLEQSEDQKARHKFPE